ncbi:MAG: cytochrome c-type biogenesis protein [Geminicoccales bacterium]
MKRRPRAALLMLAAVFALFGTASLSALAAEEVYDERTVDIARQLSCPVCEGQTVADSHSRVAEEMRNAIQAQVDAGRSDDEIYDYFRARYGDEVLVEPPREGINLALWWLPVVVVALGLGVVALYMRDSAALGRRRALTTTSQGVDPELEQIAEQAGRETQGQPRARPTDRPAESS